MRRATIGLGLAIVLLASGCNNWPHTRTEEAHIPAEVPGVPQLVGYLNDNARRVQAIQCPQVAIDCKQGNQRAGLDGMLVCQKPRNFRLRAKLFGQPAVDIGSNDSEFWYWISKADPPYVFHCAYQDLSQGNVAMPFPFQPDMVVAALGLAEYDPNKKYEVRPYDRYLELIESTTSPQGQPVQKVTVFNRAQAAPGQPQVIAHVLKDLRGNLICKATVYEVQVNRETGAILPKKVTLVWPPQRIEMALQLYDTQVVSIAPDRATALFHRNDLATIPGYDLARRTVENPGGLQRASNPPP